MRWILACGRAGLPIGGSPYSPHWGCVAFGLLDENVHVPGLEDWSVFFLLFCAMVVLPDLSLGMRRLHDTGRRGWIYVVWIIVSYGSIRLPEPNYEINIPEGKSVRPWDFLGYNLIYSQMTVFIFFGLMIIIVMMLTRGSQPGANRYGPNPKGIGNPDIFS